MAGALLAAFLTCPLPGARAQDASAYSVVDSTSGRVLMARNPGKRLAVGSLTDIATAMVVLDWLDLRKHDTNETVSIPPDATTLPVRMYTAIQYELTPKIAASASLFLALAVLVLTVQALAARRLRGSNP